MTQEQVTEAVLAFKNKGGLIRRLPPELAFRRSNIGHRWDSMYETVLETT